MKAFLVGCLVGAALWWGVGMLMAPSPDEIEALERHEKALAGQLHRERSAVLRDTETVHRVIGEWPDLRLALADPALPAALRLRAVTWGDHLTEGCSLLVRDCTTALATSDSLTATVREERDEWKRLARGPFLQKSAEVFLEDGRLMGAAEIDAGRGRVSAVARVEVDTLARLSWGVRVRF